MRKECERGDETMKYTKIIWLVLRLDHMIMKPAHANSHRTHKLLCGYANQSILTKNNKMNKFVTHKQNWMRWLDGTNVYYKIHTRAETMWKRKKWWKNCAQRTRTAYENFCSSETIDRSKYLKLPQNVAVCMKLFIENEISTRIIMEKRASGKQRSMPPFSFIAYIWIAITFSLRLRFFGPISYIPYYIFSIHNLSYGTIELFSFQGLEFIGMRFGESFLCLYLYTTLDFRFFERSALLCCWWLLCALYRWMWFVCTRHAYKRKYWTLLLRCYNVMQWNILLFSLLIKHSFFFYTQKGVDWLCEDRKCSNAFSIVYTLNVLATWMKLLNIKRCTLTGKWHNFWFIRFT